MRSFVAQFAENLWAVIPSYTSFASFGSIRDVSVLEVDWSKTMSLNVGLHKSGNRQNRGGFKHRIK